MELLFFDTYLEKRQDKDFQSLNRELNAIEEKFKNMNMSDLQNYNFYRSISSNKKIVRFARSKGDYRLAIFLDQDAILFVDFEVKQNLGERYEDKLFLENDDIYMDFINKNRKVKKEERINLNSFLDDLNQYQIQKQDMICFESKYFANSLKNYSSNLVPIFDLIKSIVFEEESYKKLNNFNTINYFEKNGFNLIFKVIAEENFIVYFLIDLRENLNIDDINFDLKQIDSLNTKNEISRFAKKAYPAEIFLEDDSKEWIEYIVKNSDGNISLSPEEESILLSINSYNDEKFPLFINGRAGSGKSTILQYLFADYLIRYLEMKDKYIDYEPLYLTYNNRLKEKAIEKVINVILAKTPKDIKKSLNLITYENVYNQIEHYFQSFDVDEGSSFLEKLLNNNTFKNKEKIKFHNVKPIFEEYISKSNKKLIKNLTPELIWYVIRSFIKGKSTLYEDKIKLLDYESYKNLDKKQKVIDDKIFKIIREEIYPFYENYLKENNFYDDLDVVLEVFKQNSFNKKFSVIFCDEAQDFTKVEFDLILNLNIFLDDNVEINKNSYYKIPVAFAGDPFQTINPTGFSFETLKANVYESYKARNLDIELNYHELQYNYRSQSSIIKFSNSVQLFRNLILKETNNQFQKNWLVDDKSISVLYFDVEDNDIKQFLSTKDFLNFIFPIERDLANKFISNEELKEYYRKYLTPLIVKGLEFDWVVLYKFGDYFINNYTSDIESLINTTLSKEKLLPYEYFLNNFYVGITRAKEKLLIVDTKEGFDNFWSKLNKEKLVKLYKNILGNEIEESELGNFVKGDLIALQYDEKEGIEWIKRKIKLYLFDRFEDEMSDKKSILEDIRFIIENNKLNEVYNILYEAYYLEYNDKLIDSVERLLQALSKSDGELSESEKNFIIRKAFNNLWKSVKESNLEKINTILNNYRIEFEKLGLSIKDKIEILKLYIDKKYKNVIDKILSSIIENSITIRYLVLNSLLNIEDKSLVEKIKDLYAKDYITVSDIIDIIKKLQNKADKKILLKLFEIDNEIKKSNKNLYCELKLQIDKEDIDCLIATANYEKVIDILTSKNKFIDKQYAKNLLFYIDKSNKNYQLIDLEDLLTIFNSEYTKLSMDLFKYLINSIFDKDELNTDEISLFLKFFDENRKQKEQYFIIFVSLLYELIDNRNLQNPYLFDTLITLFSSFEKRTEDMILKVIVLLESVIDFYDERRLEKLLKFYSYHLKSNKKLKYRNIIAFRYLKLSMEFKKNYSKEDTFSFITKKIFPKYKIYINKSYEDLLKTPLILNKDKIDIVKKAKTVDEVIEILNIKDEKNNQDNIEYKNDNVQNISLNKDLDINDIFDMLETIEDFVSSNNINKRDIRTIKGYLNSIEEKLKDER